MGLKLRKIKLPTLKRAKAAVQKVKAQVKKAGGNAKQKATNMLLKGRSAAALALFGPFGSIAVKYLIRRGIKPAKTNKGLVRQIRAVGGSKNFGLADGQTPDCFDVRMEIPEGNYGLADDAGTVDPDLADAAEGEPSPAMVQAVIQMLITIFQGIKAKQAAGQPLSEDEKKIADIAGDIDDAVQESKDEAEAIDGESEKEAGNFLSGFDWKKGLALVIIVLLIIFFIRR